MTIFINAGKRLTIFFILLFLYSCTTTKEIEKGVVYIKAKKYQGYIWDEHYPLRFNTNATRWNPTIQDIKEAERLFSKYLKTYELDTLHICSQVLEDIKQNTGSYYRQYFGWFDKNGDRILIINAYHIKEIDTDKKKEYFKTYYFSILAMCPFRWYVEINFDKKKCLNFEYGG